MIRIGITGGIGSGKSTVSELFRLFGIPVYIADIESKKITANSPVVRDKLTKAFGKELYLDNQLNKTLLASIIFSDKEKLALANSIIHPEVDKHYAKWCENQSKTHQILGLETAILYESGMVKLTDKVLLVYTSLAERVTRTMKRDNTTKDKVLERINNQESDEEKMKKVDFIIYNNEKYSLINQTKNILQTIN